MKAMLMMRAPEETGKRDPLKGSLGLIRCHFNVSWGKKEPGAH